MTFRHPDRYKRLLGMPGWIGYGAREEGERLVVSVGKLREEARRERCGKRSFRVHQRRRWRQVRHMGLGGKGVYLELSPSRYWCSRCGRVFTEEQEEIRYQPSLWIK